MMQSALHPHVVDEILCEPFFEELHFQNTQHSFASTWDLTPPDSPCRPGEPRQTAYDHDFSRVTVNLEQRDFSPCNDLSSVMWNDHGVGAFETRDGGDWTAPPSPVVFEELTDICNDMDSYQSFELEHEAALLDVKSTHMSLIDEPVQSYKRKAVTAPASAPYPKAVCKAKAGSLAGSTSNIAVTAGKGTGGVSRARPTRRTEPSPSPSSEDDPESKRHTHNVLERRRRNELKSSYQELREEIPDLYSNDKTPTGVILNRACEYIAALQEEEAMLMQGIALAKAENARLRKLCVA